MQLVLDLPDCDAADLASFLAHIQPWEQAHPQVTIQANVYAPLPHVDAAYAVLAQVRLAHAQVLTVASQEELHRWLKTLLTKQTKRRAAVSA